MDAKAIGILAAILLVLALLAGGSSDDRNSQPQPKGYHCVTLPDGTRQCMPYYRQGFEPFGEQNYGPVSAWERRYVGDSRPAVDLPEELRKRNWLGTGGGGSCVNASIISGLNWLAWGSGDPQLYDLAASWPYSGGEYSSRCRQRIEDAGLRFVMTVDGDDELLKWAVLTRRGACIAAHGHCRNLVGYDAETGDAIILDNNHVTHYDRQPWGEMVNEWQTGGGWAFAFVYDPPAPIPNVASN